jgi:hypothetical protein
MGQTDLILDWSQLTAGRLISRVYSPWRTRNTFDKQSVARNTGGGWGCRWDNRRRVLPAASRFVRNEPRFVGELADGIVTHRTLQGRRVRTGRAMVVADPIQVPTRVVRVTGERVRAMVNPVVAFIIQVKDIVIA